MEQYYSFNSSEFTEDPEVLELVGSRGKRVMELASLGAPISPGFLLPNETVRKIAEEEIDPWELLQAPIETTGKIYGRKFNDKNNPLLLKVVESPILNMVTTFSTIHNIGLCESTVDGFAAKTNESFAYHEYAGVFQKIAELEILTETDSKRKARLDAFVKAIKSAKAKSGFVAALDKNRDLFPPELFSNTYDQLLHVIKLFYTLFQSSDSRKDSCLLVQVMVFGNYGEDSCFGNFFTHDIISGKNELNGEFFENAFDEREKKGKSVLKMGKKVLSRLQKIGNDLEQHFKEIRRVRFTVENGRLWLIDQNPVPNKSTQAEIKTLLDLHKAGAVDDEYIINAIKPGRLSEILHPSLDPLSVSKFSTATGGIAGSVGAAIGRVYFSTESLIKAYRMATQIGEDTDFILAMPSTYAEDVKAIEVSRGVLSSEGGYASHAPVVARSLGKVALVYPGAEFQANALKIGKKTVKEGEYITINVPYYDPPTVYFGKGSLSKPTPEGSGLLELLEIVQNHIDGDFDVHANADQPRDAELAKTFKAKGIGLCRTEHMFFHEDRINIFRSMILAESREERLEALKHLEKMQIDDFTGLLKTMAGYPVTIRLLDAPLHEFLPHTKDSMDGFLAHMKKKKPKITAKELQTRCDMLREVNPMLGHRGIRVAISYPEIYNMQVRAIFQAAYKLKSKNVEVFPEIMIPIVMGANEVKTIRSGKRIEGKAIIGIDEVEQEIAAKFKCDPVHFKVGSMIELPAAALQADRIARYAEFLSFGTNDLTQTTNGLSRDDFNNFFSDYNEFDLLEENPFKVLGEQVKEMVKLAAERARLTRPDIVMGICGEHGAEPANIPYCREIGLNYVSCSPYGVPIAKLAIAQLILAEKAAAAE
ncbi:MAG: pyruvate, phosphate dikinase [Spirochaetaceae bacterium]|nr:MAG: pyruvate, phosphate dikinase [Spirochaetaceae bacterium]